MSANVETASVLTIRSKWEQIFLSNDPFIWPFRPEFTAGRIFYPTDGYHLTKPQFMAVMEASKKIGENELYISIVESDKVEFLERAWGHWSCENLSYEGYIELPLILENTIYSKKGNWGILISHEMHALISGSREFMVGLDEHYREWSNDFQSLREAWSDNQNSSWLEPMVNHVGIV